MTDTYSDLQSAIVRELSNRSDLTTEIQAAIYSAISHYQKHKFWFSEETETAATVNGQASLALPSDLGWVDGITIIYSTYPIRMERRDWKTMQDLLVNTTILLGQPTDYAIQGNVLWFWPTPNGAYTLTMYENFQNAPPVNGTDSSCWTIVGQAEELIRSRAVADIYCHILKRQASLEELGALGELPYFSKREMVAHKNLLGFTNQRLSSGTIRPIAF